MIEVAVNDNEECKFVDEIYGPVDEERVWLDADHPYCRSFVATVERYWGDAYRFSGVIPEGAPDRWRVVWRDFDTSLQDEIFEEYAAAWLRKGELERNFRSAHWEVISDVTFAVVDHFWKGLSRWAPPDGSHSRRSHYHLARVRWRRRGIHRAGRAASW